MIRRIPIYFCILFAAFCQAATAQQTTSPVPSVSPLSVDTGSDLVVLRVAGEPITEKQVVAAINILIRQKQLPAGSQQQHNVALFNGAVENIIAETLLRNQARQQNLDLDPAKVDRQLQQISGQFPSKEEFQKALAAQGMTDADLRKNIEESMRIQQVLDTAVQSVPEASDAEIQKFYDDNPQKFTAPEQIHAAHIILMVNKDTSPEQKEEIRKKIGEIRSEIESNKISFSDAAAKYSQEAGTAQKGGDLGFFSRGQMVKPFEEAAFNGEPGSLSQIVETPFGYHIIRIIEKKPAGTISLEEAGADIRRLLNQTSKRKAAQQFVNDLKAKAAIERFMTPEDFIKRHMSIR